jgi:hypothetical protein
MKVDDNKEPHHESGVIQGFYSHATDGNTSIMGKNEYGGRFDSTEILA